MRAGPMVEGLVIRPQAISVVEAERLKGVVLEALADVGVSDNRERSRVRRWGWDYLRPGVWLGSAPAALYVADVRPEEFESVTVNEYPARRGLGQHKDSEAFGDPIVVLSLGAAGAVRFEHPQDRLEVLCLVGNRDLMTLSGPARWEWMHGVEPVHKGTRWSVVYRHRIDMALAGA